MRYGGRPASTLRAIKAFLFAIPINCIAIGYIMLATVKVVGTLGIWESFGITEGETVLGMDPKLLSVIGVSALVLVYTSFSGLWGVVVTDFFQFFLALFGAILVAWFAVSSPEIGGLQNLIANAQENTSFDVLAFIPLTWDAGGLLGVGWSAFAGISATTFGAYVFLQWWTFRRSDGGGEFIQRLAASKDEEEAVKAAWLFNVMHYVVRTWPWILVALAALYFYPELEDKELGYPMLMLDFLPVGLLGLVVASLFAAFMSNVTTQINWGASYVVNDLYHRFVNPAASQAELVRIGRIASVVITAFGALAAFYSDSVGQVFRLVIAIGTGPGVVLILRWFWWRINAWAELSAMLAGFVIGLVTTLLPQFMIADFGIRLFVIVAITSVIWIAVMYATKPESDEVLLKFYKKVQPAGPGWRHISTRANMSVENHLGKDLARVFGATLILFGLMFGTGALLLLKGNVAIVMLSIAAAGGLLVRYLK